MYPYERSLVKKMAGKPFTLLGVNSDKNRGDLKRTIKKEGLSWRSWWDGGTTGPIQRKWQVTFRPTIFVLDTKGVIRHKGTDKKELSEVIAALVKEAASKKSPGK